MVDGSAPWSTLASVKPPNAKGLPFASLTTISDVLDETTAPWPPAPGPNLSPGVPSVPGALDRATWITIRPSSV